MWFRGGPEVDAEIVSLFLPDCEALLAGQYDSWRTQPLGALAGIILGDQLFRWGVGRAGWLGGARRRLGTLAVD